MHSASPSTFSIRAAGRCAWVMSGSVGALAWAAKGPGGGNNRAMHWVSATSPEPASRLPHSMAG
jgi:hypothetical protein